MKKSCEIRLPLKKLYKPFRPTNKIILIKINYGFVEDSEVNTLLFGKQEV